MEGFAYSPFYAETSDQLHVRLAEVEETVRLAYKMPHEQKEVLRLEAGQIREELGMRGERGSGAWRPRVVKDEDLTEIKRIAGVPERERSADENAFINNRLKAMVAGVELGNDLGAQLERVMEQQSQTDSDRQIKDRILVPGTLAFSVDYILRDHRARAGKILKKEVEAASEEVAGV